MNGVLELYGISPAQSVDWRTISQAQRCPYLAKKCIKVRKSEPDKTIGTCSVLYGKESSPIIICPCRLLEHQVFADCIHLLTLHEPGNQLHVISEVSIPGGNVDFFLVSARAKQVKDLVGIELQSLDTSGTVWPERQRLLAEKGVTAEDADPEHNKRFGMNWKMTAKTTLMQLHHKVQTFESIGKRLVLVIQDCLMDYIRREFTLDHVNRVSLSNPAHIHVYRLVQTNAGAFNLELASRYSTDANGIALSLGLQSGPNVELREITRMIEDKISDATLFNPIVPS